MPTTKAALRYRINGQDIDQVPLDAPRYRKDGAPRLPSAQRGMRVLLRDRQNSIADFMDLEGEEYDWKELSKRWIPGNGVYRPKVQYRKDRA